MNIHLGQWPSQGGMTRLMAGRPDALFVCVQTRRIGRGGVTARLPGQAALRVALALLARAGCVVLMPELIDHLVGDRDDGGAENVSNVVSVEMLSIRVALAALGVVVETVGKRGYMARPARQERAA